MVHDLIDQASYMAHGYCLLWKPWLVALHAGSDVLIFGSYFAIPVAIWLFLRKRETLELRQLAVLFAAFIFLCGLTHLIQAVTLWFPIYELQGLVKGVTAIISVATAAVMFPLIPVALAIPSPTALQAANLLLTEEIAAHRRTLDELEKARDQLEQRVRERTQDLEREKARFEALVRASAQIIWTRAPNGEFVDDSRSWRAFTGQSAEEATGLGWLNAVHDDDRERVRSVWVSAVETRSMYQCEYRLKHVSGDWRWIDARGLPLFDENGRVLEWVGMNTDVTPRKEQEKHNLLVMRELSHRTKNLLAVVQALASRTIDGKGDPKVQANEFVGRLHGLARSHDLLVQANWKGVSLEELVRTHLEPFGFEASRVRVGGPFICLTPAAAQTIGLAMHELATNVAKHGALKAGGGFLKVDWEVVREGGDEVLVLSWNEESQAKAEGGVRSGFGRYLLEASGGALGGVVEYVIGKQSISWRLRAPLPRLEPKPDSAELKFRLVPEA